jgi:hypothetical protein
MFCSPGLIFDSTVGVGSHFHVLRSRTLFRRYQGRRVPFSCSTLPDSFSAVPRVSGPVFMFSKHGLIFDGTAGIGSRIHVLCSRTHFRRCRMRRVPFPYFALSDSFSAVPRASGPVFMFWRSRTHFRRYRKRRVPYSCFTRPNSFSAVPRASGPFIMFCPPGLVFGSTEGVESCFHILCSRTHFGRCRVRRVAFSCFACPDSFSTVPSASCPVFIFCAPGLIFDGIVGVVSRFHVLRSQTYFRQYRERRVPFSCFPRTDSFSTVPRASGPVFMFCAPGLVFGGAECVGSRFHILPTRTHFRRCRGRWVPYSCFTRPYSFSAVRRASGPFFMFGTPELIFRARTRFRRYRGRHLPFSCFVLPDSFSAVTNASGTVFIFFLPELVFDDTEGVGSRFHVLCSQTRFWWC